MSIRNLKEETLEVLKEYGKTMDNVEWVGSADGYIEKEDFLRLADIEYYGSFGAQEVASDLVIVGDDFYMIRGEYDGSEWWEYHSIELFRKPENRLEVTRLAGGMWDTLKELNE